MNTALKHIHSVIDNQGHISIYDFLKIVIPYYYSHNNAIGKSGDFTTAPEISQIFGETIAFCILNQYQHLGLTQASLLELGPGKGTLMQDILRVISKFKQFNIEKAYMLEISDSLKDMQKSKLSSYTQPSWIDSIRDVKSQNIFIIGNEFFDALPIRQLEQTADGCYEVVITQDATNNLSLSKIKISNTALFKEHGIYEISDDATHIINQISELNAGSIFCIFIDYGYTKLPLTSTIQALHKHSHINFLEQVGETDITSLVNFSSLASQFTQHGFECSVLTQSDFLKQNGIEVRAQQLIKHGANQKEIEAAFERLTSPSQMGELFKVLIAYRVKA